MAIKPKDIYRGKRRYRTLITVLVSIFLALLIGAIVLFYSLQKYLTYSQDGVSLELPIFSTDAPDNTEEPIGTELTEPVEIVVATPNFDDIPANSGEGLAELKAIYIPYDKVSEDGISAAVDKAEENGANALVFQLKPASGYLAYRSTVELTDSYGVNGALNMHEIISALKEESGLWMAAEISVCIDDAMAARNAPIALKNYEGSVYSDSEGSWLDPYSRAMRAYITGLMAELSDIGFDEIILTNVAHPADAEAVVYSQTMTSTLDVNSCVYSLAMWIKESMDGYDVRISALYKGQSGQDMGFFMKVFDRLCRETPEESLGDYKSQAGSAMMGGDVNLRFVPIVQYASENPSWIRKISD